MAVSEQLNFSPAKLKEGPAGRVSYPSLFDRADSEGGCHGKVPGFLWG